MCGVIGVSLSNISESNIELVREVFKQTMIRGKHATGLSFVKNGEVHTIKQGVPVNEFFKNKFISDYINEDGGLYLIGHIRYSTSDIKYNQPFSNGDISISHNGVLSQQKPSEWKYKCETANDSEMILRSYEAGKVPLEDFMRTSMAVTTLSKDKSLSCYRNHERPLWYSQLDNGIIFTSTKDIAKRSGLNEPSKCDMFVEYNYTKNTLSKNEIKRDVSIRDLQ
jgi:glutamine phosphoribosylpyrophosphate amidotransferase